MAIFSPEENVLYHLFSDSKGNTNQVIPAINCIKSSRDKNVFLYLHGFTDGNEHSLKEASKIFNLSGERCRQINHKCLRFLRQPMFWGNITG
jgi:DNA-directed RNA polymerase sigma subunit (sigma70/sigma32)